MSDREELEALRRMAELEAKAGVQTPQPEQAPKQPTKKELLDEVMNKRPWGSGFPKFMRELGGKVTDITGSPLLGAVVPTLGEAIPMALTSARVVNPEAAAPVMEKAAKGLMHSALKPSGTAIQSGDAGRAIDTLLQENANISAAGNAKLRELVSQLNAEVAQKIAAAPGATVDKSRVAREVFATLKKFQSQVNKRADVKQILASWKEFSDDFAAKIPVAEAQKVKQGTYRILSDKYAKGGLPAIENEASTQAQMAQARGLRMGIEEKVPGVGELNARESAIINALELSEKRAGIAGNKDLGGIVWLAHHPTAAVAMMADRSSAFKSWLANKLFQARNQVPAATRAVGMSGAAAIDQQE